MKVFLAGRVVVETDGVVIDERRFPGRQGRLLFAYLAAEQGRAVPRGELAEALWGAEPPSTWEKALSVLVSKLRVLLANNGIDGASTLTGAFGCYRLELPEGSWVDVLAAASAAYEAEQALAAGETRRAKAAAALAESVVRQPLLPGDDGTWVEEKRRELAEIRARALTVLADASLRSGDARDAARWAEHAIALEPFRESGHRRLMEAHVAAGDRAEALRAYDTCRRLLADELGAYPSPETESIYRALLEAPPPPTQTTPSQAPPSQTRDHDGATMRTAVSIAGRTHRLRSRRALVAVAAGIVLLLAAVAAAAIELTGGSPVLVPVAANSLAAIDPSTDRVSGAVSVGARPGAIAFGDGSLWVANVDDQSVSRVDPGTLQTVRTISLPDPPSGLAVAGGQVWVSASSSSGTFVLVRRIDPQFDTIDRTVRVGNLVPNSPAPVAAARGTLWVAPYAGDLTHLNAGSGRIVGQVDPNAAPSGLALQDGAAWVSDSEADNVTRVDATGLVTAVAVGHAPSGIAAGGGAVWVADTGDNAVVRIDPETHAVTATIRVGSSPTGVAVGAGSVWVANSGDGTVTRIDSSNNEPIATITVGGSPTGVAVAGGRAWVTVDAPTLPTGSLTASGAVARLDSQYDVSSMDPALAYDSLSAQLFYATCAKLLNYPDNGGPAGSRLVPEVAQSLPARSADGRTYTFTIRRGFRFSPPSNLPVTAQTFKDTIERTLSPHMQNPTGPPVVKEFDDIVGEHTYTAGKAPHIAGVIARADTLTIRLTAPAPDLPARLAQPFFCAVPSNTPPDPKGLGVIPSAGPYRVASYAPGQGVVLTRNPNYHGARPHRLQRIELAVNIPTRRAVEQVLAGKVDYAVDGEIATADAATLAARYGPGSPAARTGHQRYFVNPFPQLDLFALNTHRPLFSDVRMRRAVNYAIDRAALARLGGADGTLPDHPTDHYLPPGIPGYTDLRSYPLTPDLAASRKLAAGHAPATAVLYTCDQPPCAQQAQVVKTNLAAIGIRVETKVFAYTTLFRKYTVPGERFDIAAVGWGADYPDPDNFLNLLLDSGTIIPTFNDSAYRARLAAAARLSGARRYLTYARLDRDLTRDAAPWIAYGNASSHELYSSRIGCQTYGFYGVDLAALCVRRTRG